MSRRMDQLYAVTTKSGSQSVLPSISFAYNSRRWADIDRDHVEAVVRASLPMCIREAKSRNAGLVNICNLELSVIGSRRMARVHREFLGIPGTTDVITFPYGEILVCAEVAARRAPEFGKSIEEELALYMIHGLLHLAGHDDVTESAARRMHRTQERILRMACDKTAGPRPKSRIP